MAVSFIKYFTIIFWTLFIFIKLINRKPTFKITVSQIIYAVFLSFIISLIIKLLSSELLIIFIIIFTCVFNKIIIKAKWDITLIASFISCGFSYILNAAANVLISFIFSIVFGDVNHSYLIFFFLCTFPVMGLFIFSLFKIKRLKNGFPFLNEKYISLLGVIISLIVLQCLIIISVINERIDEFDNLSWFLFLCVAACAVLVIIWWRTGITKTYRDSLSSSEIKKLKLELAEKEKRIAEVEAENTALSKITHSDNKMIPALGNAVRDLCENYSETKASALKKELNRIYEDRKGVWYQYKKDSKQLPSTKITSLDMTLDFMKQKAYESNIEFDCFVSGNIKYMILKLIKEEQLRKVSADLLENAIIAVKPCKLRNILFTVGICDEAYEIRAEDSGIDFEEETLLNLGKERTTTHKNEGGSGFGLMEAFDVIKDTGASLIIKKLPHGGLGFTKQVSLRFDGKSEYRVDYEGLHFVRKMFSILNNCS
ncbi:MAG: hypothetical protein FWG44_04355 [Oscillospiraceae bacterium]|nr:hypothetical protein [Oscillospiraceae bacterium]